MTSSRPAADHSAIVLTRREARARLSSHPSSGRPRRDGGDAPRGWADTPTDPFETAARLLSFPTARRTRSDPAPVPPHLTHPPAQPDKNRTAPRRRGKRLRRVFFTARILGLVGVMTVGMTVDAEALPHTHDTTDTSAAESSRGADTQGYTVSDQVESISGLQRDNYVTETVVDLAGTVGITNFSSSVFTNDASCVVQWPYAVGVPITYGFGMRNGRMHEGTDFIPGAGAQIQTIADGVVRTSTDNGGAFGVTIVIDHVIDGQRVSSRYAHMEYNSRQVQVGDVVRVGQYIGRTGNTGRSFGAHLHFEVLQQGTTATDPVPWLRANAAC